MYIQREQFQEIYSWMGKKKILILRGPRQVGKTTVIKSFSEKFDQFIYLNLDIDEDIALFEDKKPFEELLDGIFFLKGKKKDLGKTLLFIDEIQNSPSAVEKIRYFYEKAPDLYVIAAGSLLETLIDIHISFPVGRCEYMVLKPMSFIEFLKALGEDVSAEMIQNVEIPDYAHSKILELFRKYTYLGGMPEAISVYVESDDYVQVNKVFESLLVSYMDDVEKYSSSKAMENVIRHCISSSFEFAGSRIKFEGFGGGRYKSREIGEATRTLEKAMLLYLIYPATNLEIPITTNKRMSPRLQTLDTGLINYFTGVQSDFFKQDNIMDIYKGKIIEHIIGQEFLASSFSPLHSIKFWVRDKKQSSAEVDFIINYNGKIVPVEVKSGSSGKMKSLHYFMDNSESKIAVRIYSEKLNVDILTTQSGKKFKLINMPYYLAGNIHEIIRKYSE